LHLIAPRSVSIPISSIPISFDSFTLPIETRQKSPSKVNFSAVSIFPRPPYEMGEG